MSALDTVVSIVQTVYFTFFVWLPVSFQVLLGAILTVAALYLVVKVIGAILGAIPFL